MSRHLWTLTLILICLPILATVITAFRIRDLPKVSHDSAKKEHCDDCEAKVGHKLNSVRIDSDKRPNVETKNDVREKLEQTNKKPLEPHITHKYVTKSDKDDDDDLDVSKIRPAFKNERVKAHSVDLKTKAGDKNSWSLFSDDYDNEDDEVNDDDDNDDDEYGDSYSDDDDDDDEMIRKHPITPKIPRATIINVKKKTDLPKSYSTATFKISETKNKLEKRFDFHDDEDEDSDENIDDRLSKFSRKQTKNTEAKNEEKIKVSHKEKSLLKAQSNEEIHSKEDGERNSGLKAKDKPSLKSTEKMKDDDTLTKNTTDSNTKNAKQHLTKHDVDLRSNENFEKDKNNARSKIKDSNIPEKFDSTESKRNKISDTQVKKAIDEKSKKDQPLKTDSIKTDVKSTKQSTKQPKIKELALSSSKEDQAANKEKQSKDQLLAPSDESEEFQTSTFWSPLTFFLTDNSKEKDDIESPPPKKDLNERNAEALKAESKAKSSPSVSKISIKSKSNLDDKAEVKIKTTDTSIKSEKHSENMKTNTIPQEIKKDLKKETKDKSEKAAESISHKSVEQATSKVLISRELKDENDSGGRNFEKKTKEDSKKQETLGDEYKLLETMKEFKVDRSKKCTEKQYIKSSRESTEKLVDGKEVKSGSHLKQMNDALQRRNLLKSEFDDFYSFFPTFAPNFSRIHNPECRRHGQIVLRQLRGTKLWALNMLDATAKIPAGILQGNGIQLGDFDQCLSSRARVQLDTGSVVKVQGKYCLVHLDVKAEHPELETPVHLAQAKNLIRGRIDDPGHFVPRFSTLSWGICVPSACDPGDVELVFRDAIKHYQKTSGFAIRVKVEEEDCHVEDLSDLWQRWLEPPVLATLVFYGVIILLVIVGTVQDFLARLPTDEGVDEGNNKGNKERSQTKDGIFTVFSLYRTVSKLTASGTSDEIPCIHGVRAIATIALLVAHKFFPVANMPYTNRLRITDTVSSPMWSWCRAGWMFTDCFLLLSGTLTAHRMSIDTETAAPKRLFSRYIRLTPALLAVVLFYAYIWDNISSGPMWGTFVTKNAEICQQGWWWNLLYVQNYFGLEEMCAPQTHQLALDMQLTILGGIVVWAIQVKKGLSLILLPVLHGVAAYLRYSTVRDHRLTLLAYHGVSVSQLYRTARLSYTSTLHRSTAYLIGITLGMALTKPTRHGKIILTLGWLTSGMLWALVWWAGIDSGSTSYRYSASFAAQYAGLAPIASAMAIAWLIYAVNNGNYGLLSQFLCCRPLAIISRLSYALYLCQFIIFMTNLGVVRNSSEFTLMSLVDLQEIAAILISSIILTLTLVIPMQSFHKLLKFSFKFENNLQNGPKTEKNETNSKEICSKSKEEREIKQKPRAHFLAHREVLEEIPEEEVEYEMHRHKNEVLDEIVEEEENEELGEVDQHHFDEELDVIEEEQGGEEAWVEREYDERPYSREDNELDEWEWTANNDDDAQYFRNIR